MHCVLLYNPASGRNRRRRIEELRLIADTLSGLGHQVELAATTAPGSATEQAREAVRGGADIVFACGGDGTIHEVLQGLVFEGSEPITALGIIPLGSANALARHLGLSPNPLKAALQEIQGIPHTVPVGKIALNGFVRYFTVMAGAGSDGALVYSLQSAHKSHFGRLAYYLHAARLFATRRFDSFEVEFVESESGATVTQRAVSVMAVRVKNLGGLFSKLTSNQASIEDTSLQLLIVRPPAALSLPLWFVSCWFDLHRFNHLFSSVQVAGFSCRPSSEPAPHFQSDGEWLGRIPVQVSLVPAALRILLPIRE